MHAPAARRVVHVLAGSSGGIRRHVNYLARHPPDGYQTAGVIGPPSLAAYFDQVPFAPWDSYRPWRRFSPSVIHAHGLTAGINTLKSTRLAVGRPAVVVTVHTSRQQTLRSTMPLAGLPFVQRGLWQIARLIIGRADAVVAVSPELAQQLGTTWVVPPAVDLAPPPSTTREQTRRSMGTAPDKLVVLAVGRLHPDKSLITLIEALRSRDVEGWVAGDGPDRARLEEAAAAAGGNTRLLGPREDVPALLAAADIFALPTAAESYGFAAMEAVAAGLPVVCTATGSIPQIVGNAGLLTPAGDAATFIRALHRVIDSPELRADLSANARLRKLPSPADLAALVGRVYDRVLDPSGRPPPPAIG